MGDSSSTSSRKRAGPLPEACDFPRSATKVSSWEALTLSESRRVSRAVSLLSGKFTLQTLSASLGLHQWPRQSQAVRYYRKESFQHHPEDFFVPPSELPAVCVSHPHRLSRGEVVDLTFRSRFQPNYKQFAEQFSAMPENQQVYAKLWRHPPGESLGTIIAIHGWLFGDSRLSAITLIPGFFYRLGLDVIVYELPYHGRRAPAGSEHQPLFPSADIPRTNEGFAQAVFELRSLYNWCKAQGAGPVGVVGMSLGGYTASLWAALDALDFVMCAAPLVSLADLAWKILAAEEQQFAIPEQLSRQFSIEMLRDLFAVHCALSYPPATDPSKMLILAGMSDPIIPEAQPRTLWEHWGRPRIEWLMGDHLGQILQPTTLETVHGFLNSLGLAHPTPLDIR